MPFFNFILYQDLPFQTPKIIIRAIITAKPSEPRVAITGSMFPRTLPKNGAEGPNKMETNTETATTKAKSLVASHNHFLILSRRSILPPM